MRFFKFKFWIRVFANLILSKKSKNSRMGAGVGSVVRLAMLVYQNTWLFWLRFFTKFLTIKMLKFIEFKTKLHTKLLYYKTKVEV